MLIGCIEKRSGKPGSMDEELVAKSYPESGGQWLSVQMDISGEWWPSSICTGTRDL